MKTPLIAPACYLSGVTISALLVGEYNLWGVTAMVPASFLGAIGGIYQWTHE